MAKGENIFKRKDGRWEARYIKGYELSGKIKYGFCYGKTYREAKEKVAKYKLALASGKPILSTGRKHRFSFYCDEWLNQKKQKVRESTYIKYETVLEKHIKPKIGSCFPLGITAELVDAFSSELLYTDKLAVKSVHDILVILRSILKYTSSHFPNQFPAIEINYPKENKKEMRVLTLSEQKRFIEYLLEDIDPCKFGVLLALFTGIRIGELCALQWKDVSIHEQSIHIDATMQRIHDIQNSGESKTKIIIGEPKSGTSVTINGGKIWSTGNTAISLNANAPVEFRMNGGEIIGNSYSGTIFTGTSGTGTHTFTFMGGTINRKSSYNLYISDGGGIETYVNIASGMDVKCNTGSGINVNNNYSE